ncbi:MAG: hypothetical protein JWM28_907 [Chitinophagaceae bacterium]|nr:hypothetical protein [Chitinophagaceae bacterium]
MSCELRDLRELQNYRKAANCELQAARLKRELHVKAKI